MWWTWALAAPPDVTAPLDTGASAATDAAVIFGVEDYAFLADVPYARRDHEAWRAVLQRTRGVPNDRIFGADGQVDATTLRREVERASAAVGAGGTLWIVYSGHGYAGAAGERLLLPSEATLEDPRAGAVGLPDLLVVAERSKAARVLVVLDACFSGKDRSGAPLTGAKEVVPLEVAQPPDRVTVWAATEAEGVALPWSAARQGRFTWFAVGALRGWADGALGPKEADGRVSYAEAQEFVRRGLSEAGAASRPTRDLRAGWATLELSRGTERAPPSSTWEDAAKGGYRTVYAQDFRGDGSMGKDWIGGSGGYRSVSMGGVYGSPASQYRPTLLVPEPLGDTFRVRWTLAVNANGEAENRSGGTWVEVGSVRAGVRVDGTAWLGPNGAGAEANRKGRPAVDSSATPLLGGMAYVLELRREAGACELYVNGVRRRTGACPLEGEATALSFVLSDGLRGPQVVLQDVAVSVPSGG